MTNNQSGLTSNTFTPGAAAAAAPERRRAPRIAPLSADIYSTSTAPRESSLNELKARSRKPGEASFFYLDHHFQHNAVKVLPGEYFVADESMVIMTVLGSCIAACLWDSRAHIGGMNHFMLPDGDLADASGRYGSYAMELLINEMLKLGARRETMQAKIFGGAQVMHNFTTMNVGERNTTFVLNYLHTERIPIVSEDVLDIYPRKVVFFPVTGKAMVKRLAHAHPETLVEQEVRGNAATVAKSTSGGSVDLF
ncbi:chemotaxis protein, stimulates methylation of MCP proteins [Acidovorax sp. CF316]|uniref:chemoreceptor glutamine deamidase CheD n=1 Tax=Acidovorax sp. CF316 TaxID=1144317 RepID=UPI00026BD379|nr:chemotaxis protein, stimulates methylation of MCP proteins [Acidovorax sp. CF316]